MLYRSGNTDLKHHVHPKLRRNIRLFILMSVIMILIAGADLAAGTLSLNMAIAGTAVGTLVGFASSRIFHLSWDKDGSTVVSRIDTVGWVILILYIAFEVARASIFQVLFDAGSSTAVFFIFVGAAMIARVLGIRGRIFQILRDEKVFR